MNFDIKEKAMKEKIENYRLNERELDRLYKKLIESYESVGKITPAYGLNTGGRGTGFISKVENVVINRISVQEKISILEDEVYDVNISQRNALNELESEVIEYIKHGFKMSQIARTMKKGRKDIKKIRDNSIKKMTLYVINNT